MNTLASEIAEGHVKGRHAVYLLADENDAHVYIGRTNNVLQRLQSHTTASAWWPQVASGWWMPCANVVEARILERDCIARYTPVGNINDALRLKPARKVLPEATAGALRHLYCAAVGAGKHSDADERLNSYILALHDKGWVLAAIGQPLGFTREAIRLRVARGVRMDDLPFVPDLPPAPIKVKPKRREIPNSVVAVLRDMHAVARTVNGGTPAGHHSRGTTVAFTELCASLVIDGFTVAEVARAVGVTHFAISSRLARHGWTPPVPSMASQAYKGTPTQHLPEPSDRCLRGHPFSDANVRFINGDPHRRICRACERIRVAKYRSGLHVKAA